MALTHNSEKLCCANRSWEVPPPPQPTNDRLMRNYTWDLMADITSREGRDESRAASRCVPWPSRLCPQVYAVDQSKRKIRRTRLWWIVVPYHLSVHILLLACSYCCFQQTARMSRCGQCVVEIKEVAADEGPGGRFVCSNEIRGPKTL